MEKTLQIHLQELREEIAQQLILYADLYHGSSISQDALSIVRGTFNGNR